MTNLTFIYMDRPLSKSVTAIDNISRQILIRKLNNIMKLDNDHINFTFENKNELLLKEYPQDRISSIYPRDDRPSYIYIPLDIHTKATNLVMKQKIVSKETDARNFVYEYAKKYIENIHNKNPNDFTNEVKDLIIEYRYMEENIGIVPKATTPKN